jgi:uncharacterized protein
LSDVLGLAAQNLLSPMVLFFALGLLAALAKSDLVVPEAIAKGLALYLMMAIGFKGGAQVAASGVDARMVATILGGIALSLVIPCLAFLLLRMTSKLSAIDAAATAAHYGSISIVTFIAGTQTLQSMGLDYEGYLVAVAAGMEAPAILVALLIARRYSDGSGAEPPGRMLREVAGNSSVVMLIGAFVIGWITGARGYEMVKPFIGDLFLGVLCLFLLDMGLVAGRGMREGRRQLAPPVIAFGLYMPLVSAALALPLCWLLGLSIGGSALLLTLAASASYIAVPAAMRLALPEANPSIYLTLSLGVTFPFNLTLGIPAYVWIARSVIGP